ncbi:squalene/phytoene synthase family protein [Anaerobacillus alkaliphilus]|uniref:Squalene/phytoene synthase family protein n=1 Tax=Anaerobacillus alkaliphilus TaxID=1548597 RepID=A0A4Q0VNN5_9BACI|nr:phytoene/squalene synthase family protein [Anaerobacillus alkaliphilus]RXI97768.1 squalene/phytoene synthase family protein [Anaerobacillus alkaliphilus]
MSKLHEAYQYCYEVMNANSKTFVKAFSFLPEQQRKAVWAVYTFCREVDDIVDELHSLEKLQQFKCEFDQFIQGNFSPKNKLWVALNDVFTSFTMDPEPFYYMIEGQKMDFEKVRYRTLAELEHYSFRVASSVGLMLLPILAPNPTPRLTEGAIKLGIAMQITNILRDVGEDLNRNRVYLPGEYLHKYNLREEDLLAHTVDVRFTGLVEDLAIYAERLYDEALESTYDYPLSARLPVQAANYSYRAILTEIRKNNYNVFTKRAVVSATEKMNIFTMLKQSIKAFA